VRVRLEPPAFRWMIDVTGVDLSVSRVVLDGDEPVAFALTAVRPPEAWIAGMGTVPGRRRHGLGECALTATVDAARERGAGRVLLEAIDENVAATRRYEQLGFERERALSVWML